MTYRGPDTGRIMAQQGAIMQYAGEPCTWRHFVSGGSTAGSGYYAGTGQTLYYHERTITGLFAAPQMGESRFRETQLAGGQVIAGDMVASTPCALGARDELVWRGVTYRLEGDNTPIHIGGQVWYRSVLRRGDVTG